METLPPPCAPTHSPAEVAQLKFCHPRTCHNCFSQELHGPDTTVRQWGAGSLSIMPPGLPLRKGKATVLVGWAGCCRTKKNQNCWWKASTSCSDLPKHWVLLSSSFPISERAPKGACISRLLDGVLKHLEIGNLRYQSRCCITTIRQRRISKAFQTSLLHWTNHATSTTNLQPGWYSYGHYRIVFTIIYTRPLTTQFQTT